MATRVAIGKKKRHEQVQAVGLHRHLMGRGRLLLRLFGDGEFESVLDVAVKQLCGPLDVVRFVAEVDEIAVGGE